MFLGYFNYVLEITHTYRIHECNFCGAAPGLSARGARLKAAKARAPWQCHVTHVWRAKHRHRKLHCKKG